MNRIHVKKLGLAFALTGALLYLGCMALMLTVGHNGTVSFFNSLLHGLDVSTIVRMDVPLWEGVLGIIQTFILAWLVGACIAGFYNASLKNK
ncbi:MAG TPA: DUF5676 family membrane protein [Bacteroidia bacterium]|nr:DUF5676 family membrane protein [Bacteroidia bacterium]